MSRLLKSIHSTAKGLSEAGVITKATMREFDELCLPDIKELTPREIRSLREKLGVSQPLFAHYLNTSLSSVQKWERGVRRPEGPTLKLLHVVKEKGLEVLA